jgi:glutamate/tyrosine decarboxylase-like PLP-dependent enzyme
MTNEEIEKQTHEVVAKVKSAIHGGQVADAVYAALFELVSRAYEEAARALSDLARYEAVSSIDDEAFCVRAEDGDYLDRDDALAAVRALKDQLTASDNEEGAAHVGRGV